MRIVQSLLFISTIISSLLINVGASSPLHHHSMIIPIHALQQCQTIYSVDELASQSVLLDAQYIRGRRDMYDNFVGSNSGSLNLADNVAKYSSQQIGNFNFGANNILLTSTRRGSDESTEIYEKSSSEKTTLRNDDLLKFMIV